ncbi:MAG TPA: DUF1707 domain-containing protein [Acidimicrobiales bacterium]|nr:DUF1707 domain-containing protein [Acidimicrobiales bacterium]
MSEDHPMSYGPDGSGGDDRLRLSDAERQQVVDALSRHTADGRLAMDEFEQRSEQALAARTRADLRGLLGDLPAAPGADGPATRWAGAPAAPAPAPPEPPRQVRAPMSPGPMPPGPMPPGPMSPGPMSPGPMPAGGPPAFGLPRWRLERLRGVMALSVLLIAIWLMSGAGYFWPMWVIVPVGLGALFGGGHHGCARRRAY